MTANDDAPRDAVAQARRLGNYFIYGTVEPPYRFITADHDKQRWAAIILALADECDALRAERDAADTSHATLLSMYNALHAERDALRELAQRQAARIAELEKHVPDQWRDWASRIAGETGADGAKDETRA